MLIKTVNSKSDSSLLIFPEVFIGKKKKTNPGKNAERNLCSHRDV